MARAASFPSTDKNWEEDADRAVKDAAKSLKGSTSRIFRLMSKTTKLCNSALMPRSPLKSALERRSTAFPLIAKKFAPVRRQPQRLDLNSEKEAPCLICLNN
jgi:hypothetical protein